MKKFISSILAAATVFMPLISAQSVYAVDELPSETEEIVNVEETTELPTTTEYDLTTTTAYNLTTENLITTTTMVTGGGEYSTSETTAEKIRYEFSYKNWDGAMRAGAMLSISGIDENGNEIVFEDGQIADTDAEILNSTGNCVVWVSGKEPLFIDLQPGEYIFRQLHIPDKYVKTNTIDFHVYSTDSEYYNPERNNCYMTEPMFGYSTTSYPKTFEFTTTSTVVTTAEPEVTEPSYFNFPEDSKYATRYCLSFKGDNNAMLSLEVVDKDGSDINFEDGQIVPTNIEIINSTGKSIVWRAGTEPLVIDLLPGDYVFKQLDAPEELKLLHTFDFTVYGEEEEKFAHEMSFTAPPEPIVTTTADDDDERQYDQTTTTYGDYCETTPTTALTTEQPVSDTTGMTTHIYAASDLAGWAESYCSQDNGISVNASECADNGDGTINVVLTDADGNKVDEYRIDTASGIGTNSAGEKIDLPQTGMTSPVGIMVCASAFTMLFAGLFLVFSAKKKSE